MTDSSLFPQLPETEMTEIAIGRRLRGIRIYSIGFDATDGKEHDTWDVLDAICTLAVGALNAARKVDGLEADPATQNWPAPAAPRPTAPTARPADGSHGAWRTTLNDWKHWAASRGQPELAAGVAQVFALDLISSHAYILELESRSASLPTELNEENVLAEQTDRIASLKTQQLTAEEASKALNAVWSYDPAIGHPDYDSLREKLAVLRRAGR